MSKIRLNYKKLLLWLLISTQLLIIISYYYSKINQRAITTEKVTFIRTHNKINNKRTYRTINDKIHLKSIKTNTNFINFNSSLCYINGTDLKLMQLSNFWQCKCLNGWHGKDCGQPEIIWRAFLTHKKSMKEIKGPRQTQRRLIYVFQIDKFSQVPTDIRINELCNIVDLFVLKEINGNFMQQKLNNNFLRQHQSKILYVQENISLENLRKIVVNINEDDVILVSDTNEIPNKYALNFLKFYDNWPEPLRFRLKWTVFGFFWVHPSKTVINGGASTFSYLNTLNNQFNLLVNNKGMILGDLNHFGGWFCEYCLDPVQIVEFLTEHKAINLSKIDGKIINTQFLEDIIENGIYIDGNTGLVKARRYNDNYFAPFFVLNHNWKYDNLLINFYSKFRAGVAPPKFFSIFFIVYNTKIF